MRISKIVVDLLLTSFDLYQNDLVKFVISLIFLGVHTAFLGYVSYSRKFNVTNCKDSRLTTH